MNQLSNFQPESATPKNEKQTKKQLLDFFIQNGYSLIPLWDETKTPAVKEWSPYQEKQPDADRLREWAEMGKSKFALVTGRSPIPAEGNQKSVAIVVVDCDNSNAERRAKNDCPPTQLEVRTKRGVHLLYRRPDPIDYPFIQTSAGRGERKGIDIKADGGYVVCPGSDHSEGRYEPSQPITRELLESLPVYDPRWMPNDLKDSASNLDDFTESIENPESHETLIDQVSIPLHERIKQAQEAFQRVKGAEQGRGADNYACALAINLLRDFALPAEEAGKILYQWGQKDSNVDSDGNLYPWTEKEITRKIKWALEQVVHKPSLYGSKLVPIFIEPILPSFDDLAGGMVDPPLRVNEKVIESDRRRFGLMNYWEFKKLAATQHEKWIFKNLIEQGTSTLISGLPYCGKTTIISHLISHLGSGQDFLGFELVDRCPIIFLNCDRLRERHIHRNIAEAFRDELAEEKFAECFFSVQTEKLPKVITLSYMDELLGLVKDCVKSVGTSTGIIVADTLRTAFMGDSEAGQENDPTHMAKILSPIRGYAKESNWSFLTPHHNSRGRDTYSGSAAIAGATDAIWNIRREEGSDVSTLKRQDRDGDHKMISIKKTENGLSLITESISKAKEDSDREEFLDLINQIPEKSDKAVSVSEIAKIFDWSDNSVRRWLKKATEGGSHPRLEEIGGYPVKYFRV